MKKGIISSWQFWAGVGFTLAAIAAIVIGAALTQK